MFFYHLAWDVENIVIPWSKIIGQCIEINQDKNTQYIFYDFGSYTRYNPQHYTASKMGKGNHGESP